MPPRPTRMMKGYDRLPALFGDAKARAAVQPNSIAGFRFDRIYFCSQALKKLTERVGFLRQPRGGDLSGHHRRVCRRDQAGGGADEEVSDRQPVERGKRGDDGAGGDEDRARGQDSTSLSTYMGGANPVIWPSCARLW